MLKFLKTAYQKTKEVVIRAGQGAQAFAVATDVVLSTLFNPGAAHATVDPAVATGVTALEADAATLGGIATGAVVTITLIVLGIRLVKKMLGRAV